MALVCNHLHTLTDKGSGTSGRLAFLCAKQLNKRVNSTLCHYLTAGNDRALIAAQEGAEDDIKQAVLDLKELVGRCGATHVLYVGITCGFSAPYVAAQLDYAMNDSSYTCVLLGFNPPELARNAPMEGWGLSFRDVTSHFSKLPSCFLLNPIVAPEALQGSTRMKGGTATKILLELLFDAVLPTVAPSLASSELSMSAQLHQSITSFRECVNSVYSQLRGDFPRLLEAAGNALFTGGHLYYLGDDTIGILSLIDASECVPTFGALHTDVRGYLREGWRTLGNLHGDLSHIGDDFCISWNDFMRVTVPQLSERDVVIFFFSNADQFASGSDVLDAVRRSTAKLEFVQICDDTTAPVQVHGDVHRVVQKPLRGLAQWQSLELTAKLMLNAITTLGFVQAGKVYQNQMIDLRISNNKLFFRAIGIIQRITGVQEAVARSCLLRSVYHSDTVSEQIDTAPVSAHIREGALRSRVVSTALILAHGIAPTVEAARELALRVPQIRGLL